jgi:hypothetical protein
MIYLHPDLPGCLYDAGDLALQRQFTETNAAQAEAADVPSGSSAALATVSYLHSMAAAQFTILHTFLCHTLRFLLAAERHSEQS